MVSDSSGIHETYPEDLSRQNCMASEGFTSCETSATINSGTPPRCAPMGPEVFQLSIKGHRNNSDSKAALQLNTSAANTSSPRRQEHFTAAEGEDMNDLWQPDPLKLDDFPDTLQSYFQGSGIDTL